MRFDFLLVLFRRFKPFFPLLLFIVTLIPLVIWVQNTTPRQQGRGRAASVNLTLPSPIPPFPDFEDTPEDRWSTKYIRHIVSLGIIPPVTLTTFNPQGNISRAQMAEFLLRAYELVVAQPATISATPFTDISHLPPSQQEAITKIYGLGITAGTSATTFSPDWEINRAQMATFLSNLYKAVTGDFAPEVEVPFNDIGNEDIKWAKKPIARIYGLGVTAGISATEFGPYLTVTREQMATFIYNFLRLFPHSKNHPQLAQEISQIRSVTFYKTSQGPPSHVFSNLSAQINSIKETGFNTAWLVFPWMILNPRPLANPPEYNDIEFNAVLRLLDLLKQNQMKAIIGLNYLGNNWSPEGIDYCTWITDLNSYAAFERYVAEFLARIADYSDITYILLFTENSKPCNLDPVGQAKLHAHYLRHTLGSLPSRLPKNLRDKFKIGYHDYSLVNLDFARGESPILLPNSFDFVSMTLYDQEGKNETEISSELKIRADRFRRLFPQLPLMVGETGATSCFDKNSSFTNQANTLTSVIFLLLQENLGFNLWGWRDGNCTAAESDNAGLGLTTSTKFSWEERSTDRFKLSRFYVKPLLSPTLLADIDPNSWSWKYIQRIIQTGIMSFVTASEFNPQGNIRRVEMAEFLARTYDYIADLETDWLAPVVPTPFTDISHLPQAQQQAIGKIYGLGVTAGTSPTTFSPELEINRAQMATFLSNLYKAVTGSFAPEVPTPFIDIGDIDNHQDIARIYGLGLTAGTSISPPLFSPHLIVTREQMATFIMNFIGKLFSAPLTMAPLPIPNPTPTAAIPPSPSPTLIPASLSSPPTTSPITESSFGGFGNLLSPSPAPSVATSQPTTATTTAPSPEIIPESVSSQSTSENFFTKIVNFITNLVEAILP